MDRRVIKHIGTPRHSGRYPWGSGNNSPYQRNKSFLGYVEDLKKQGMSPVDIAKGMGLNTRELREKISNAVHENRAADRAMALRLKEKGYSNVAIGERLGDRNESYVRSLFNDAIHERSQRAANTANYLKDGVDKEGIIDIGIGVEQYAGVSRTQFNNGVALLKAKGYEIYTLNVKQVATGKYTKQKVLVPPGTSEKEAYKMIDKMTLPRGYSEDGGRTFLNIEPPKSVSRDRIMVRYGDEGGSNKDGLIELRRGVEDISLGKKNYAQVRVAVDGNRFMKGMALYSDDIPKGYDIIYNTKKPKGSPDEDVFKSMKKSLDTGEVDQDNPFGATLQQKHYVDKKGKEQLSVLNVVGYKEGAGEEGSWAEWSKTLSSQVLSKQTPALAKRQLAIDLDRRTKDFEEIMSLTNPTLQKKLLIDFANEADSASIHLKAAALPRQANKVLLPLSTLKDGEVYAPGFRDGEMLALIRHPHAGRFEIPIVKANNKNAEGKRLIGDAVDAIGISPKTAKQLSGADFDGDAVLVIPNKNKQIVVSPPLKSLENFDHIEMYKKYPGMKVMDNATKQMEMGKISNLITDMTIRGASNEEIARAVKHSMVVIDAEKHELNYKQSYIDNNIPQLKLDYQGKTTGGASTLISRARAEARVPERKEGMYITNPKTGKKKRIYIDPETGEKLYTETGRTYKQTKKVKDPDTGKVVRDPITGKVLYKETGRILPATTKTVQLAVEKDAHKLSSGSIIEGVYADYSNSLKSLANHARKTSLGVKDIPYSRSARITFSEEVKNLQSNLALSYRNKPLERKAQIMANKVISAKRRSNPDMDPDQLKKVKFQALTAARARYQAKGEESRIKINDREWLAIQAGAVSPSFLNKILLNTDTKALKARALPRTPVLMSPSKMIRARAMLKSGRTRAEVADALGVSVSTLDKSLESEG